MWHFGENLIIASQEQQCHPLIFLDSCLPISVNDVGCLKTTMIERIRLQTTNSVDAW